MSIESKKLNYIVSSEESGQRADKYLAKICPDLSRSRLRSLIDAGEVMLNGKVLGSASIKVELDDELVVQVPDPVEAEPQPENIPLNIVYEDEDVIVINKAAGMVVHPGAGNWSGTLVNALLYHCGDTLSGIGGVVRPGIVHRLDKDTSGLMIVAKNDHAHQHLSAQLADRSLSRVYWALVIGVPMPIKGVVERAIGRHRHNRLKMSVMSRAPRDARTRYIILKNYAEALSLVECSLETGRTHQIRVHMEAAGHPLVGDPLYGPQPTLLNSKLKKIGLNTDLFDKLSYQFLHAKSISFVHPTSEEVMTFESELPPVLSNILKELDK